MFKCKPQPPPHLVTLPYSIDLFSLICIPHATIFLSPFPGLPQNTLFPPKTLKGRHIFKLFLSMAQSKLSFSGNQETMVFKHQSPAMEKMCPLVLCSRKVVPKGTLPCPMSSELFCNGFSHLMASGQHGELEFLLISLSITRITSTLEFSLSQIPCDFTTMHSQAPRGAQHGIIAFLILPTVLSGDEVIFMRYLSSKSS